MSSGGGLPDLCSWHAWNMWNFLVGYTARGSMPSVDGLARRVAEMGGPCEGTGQDVCVVNRGGVS